MFVAWKRPRGRDNESADVLLGCKFSIHLRKPKIVTDAETKRRSPSEKRYERIARSKARLFFYGRDGIQMSLAVFRNDVAFRINQNLGIVIDVPSRSDTPLTIAMESWLAISWRLATKPVFQ